MYSKSDCTLFARLALFDLSDDELIFAASYVQMGEKLAVFRRNTLVANMLLVTPALVLQSLPGCLSPVLVNAVHLAHALGMLGPILLVIALLITMMGDSLLNHELRDMALADDVKKALRVIAVDMDKRVFKRPFRRLAAWPYRR